MSTVELECLVEECDALLGMEGFEDYEGACNGLQVENRGGVSRVAAAVDASLATIGMARERGADLLVVHHGLFWSARHPWTGHSYRLIRALLEADLALYSAHLPLDVHPQLGNNAGLARALGWEGGQPFFPELGRDLGLRFSLGIGREELARALHGVLGAAPVVLPGGPGMCRSVGIVTGGAGSGLKKAAEGKVDTFITGEGAHWTHALAEELGVNVLYGGHYATETFGVKALAAHLEKAFGLPWDFLDHPSGL